MQRVTDWFVILCVLSISAITNCDLCGSRPNFGVGRSLSGPVIVDYIQTGLRVDPKPEQVQDSSVKPKYKSAPKSLPMRKKVLNSSRKSPRPAREKDGVVSRIGSFRVESAEYTEAPMVWVKVRGSSRFVKVAVDTGSGVTWFRSRDMSEGGEPLMEAMHCEYVLGECKGVFVRADLEMGGGERWRQIVGKANLSKHLKKGILGLDLEFCDKKAQKEKCTLHQWGLKHPAFGFVPGEWFGNRKGGLEKRAFMYAGVPLDRKLLCFGGDAGVVAFPIKDPHGQGRWFSENVQLLVNGKKMQDISVLWDTGTSMTSKSEESDIELPEEKHLIELGNGKMKIGTSFTGFAPFMKHAEKGTAHWTIGMNFLSNFVVHFQFGKNPTVTLCKLSRNVDGCKYCVVTHEIISR